MHGESARVGDVTDRLGEIAVPVLIVAGWFDAVGLDAVRKIAALVPDNSA